MCRNKKEGARSLLREQTSPLSCWGLVLRRHQSVFWASKYLPYNTFLLQRDLIFILQCIQSNWPSQFLSLPSTSVLKEMESRNTDSVCPAICLLSTWVTSHFCNKSSAVLVCVYSPGSSEGYQIRTKRGSCDTAT